MALDAGMGLAVKRRLVGLGAVGATAATIVVVMRSWRSGEPACSWDERSTALHKEALADVRDVAVGELTVRSPVLGRSIGVRRLDADSTKALVDPVPMACFALGVLLAGTPRNPMFAAEPHLARMRVVVLSSWKALDAYVDTASYVAQHEVFSAPDEVFAGTLPPTNTARRQWPAIAAGICTAWS